MSTVDPAALAKLRAVQMEGEPDLVALVVGEFLRLVPGRLERLRQAAAKGDVHALEQEAHALKGSCGMLGAGTMRSLAEQLEALGRSHGTNGAAGLVDGLEAAFGLVREALLSAIASSPRTQDAPGGEPRPS